MADILAEYNSYLTTSSSNLNVRIRDSIELSLARKYREIDNHIRELQASSRRYITISKGGALQARIDPELEILQNLISQEESKLQALKEIITEIEDTLEEAGCSSVDELQRLNEDLQGQINSLPIVAMQDFIRRTRLAQEKGLCMLAFPSDLIKDHEGYLDFEVELKDKMQADDARLVEAKANLSKIRNLAGAARAI